MIRGTVRDLVDGTLWQCVRTSTEKHRLYLIAIADTLLYVGRGTGKITERLWSHLGVRWGPPDTVGCLMLRNWPGSLEWSIQLLTTDECWDIIEARGVPHRDVFDLEEKLIETLQPCANRQHNSERFTVPSAFGTLKQLARIAEAFPTGISREYLTDIACSGEPIDLTAKDPITTEQLRDGINKLPWFGPPLRLREPPIPKRHRLDAPPQANPFAKAEREAKPEKQEEML